MTRPIEKDEAWRPPHERGEQAQQVELRREIAVGIDQAGRGDLAAFDPQVTLAHVRAEQATNKGKA